MTEYKIPMDYARKHSDEIDKKFIDSFGKIDIIEGSMIALLRFKSDKDYDFIKLEAFLQEKKIPYDRFDTGEDISPIYRMYRPADKEGGKDFCEMRLVSNAGPEFTLIPVIYLKSILDSSKSREEKLRYIEEFVRLQDFPPCKRIEDISTEE